MTPTHIHDAELESLLGGSNVNAFVLFSDAWFQRTDFIEASHKRGVLGSWGLHVNSIDADRFEMLTKGMEVDEYRQFYDTVARLTYTFWRANKDVVVKNVNSLYVPEPVPDAAAVGPTCALTTTLSMPTMTTAMTP